MKLGQQVCFSRHWVKNGSEHHLMSECGDTAYDYKKLVPVDSDPKIGIVVGKRNYGTINHLIWDEDRQPNEIGEQWVCRYTSYDSFYLVACSMVGFYKVKEADLWEVQE